MQLQRSNPTLSMWKWGQHAILNLSTGLQCRQERSGPKDPGLLLQVRGPSGIDESMKQKAIGAGVFGQSFGRRLSISTGRYTTVFQAVKTYAILAWICDIQQITKTEKYISICSASQAALKVLQAVKITSQLVRQCQRHWMIFLLTTLWASFSSMGIMVEVEMELPISSQGKVLLISCWTRANPGGCRGRTLGRGSRVGYFNQHRTLWWGLTSTQRLGNWSRTLNSLLRLGCCSLMECNPGWLQAF